MIDFTVKVYRVYEDEHGQVRDGWFFSKVYAINDSRFLVYDDGTCSSDPEYEGGFEWVDFSESWKDPWPDGKEHTVVELWEGEL